MTTKMIFEQKLEESEEVSHKDAWGKHTAKDNYQCLPGLSGPLEYKKTEPRKGHRKLGKRDAKCGGP